jgi:DUF4097 and DUF4098 domain-containing protein YvlB
MRKYLVIALLPLFLYACSEIHYWDDDTRVEESETKKFSASNIRKVEVHTKNGSIETRAWNENSIHVTLERWATGDDEEEAEDRLDDIEVSINKNSGSGVLDIEVRYPAFSHSNIGCNVFLNLPASVVLDLETSNGAITVLDSEEDLKCSSSNGAITIHDTEGYAKLRTSNGVITVNNHHGDLDGKTSNGVIYADIVLPRNGECVLKTSNGIITLAIPDSTSAILEASTSNGKIEVHDLSVSVIKMDKKKFKGKMGSGRGTIDLQTSNGNISVKNSSY